MANHIGIFVERQRAWGRRLCERVAAFAQENRTWELTTLEPEDLRNRRLLQGFDGFVARVYDTSVARAFQRLGRPVSDVSCETLLPSPFARGVLQDNAAIGALAASHFLEHRFTHFAYCGFDGKRFSDARKEAFGNRLRESHYTSLLYRSPKSAAVRLDESIARSERLDRGPDFRGLRTWLRGLSKPVGVFCANDLRAFQVSEACKDCGLKVPDEVAILGVDNDTLVCNFTNPTLSSIDPDAFSLGYSAAECLCRMLGGDWKTPPRQVGPKEIVPRVSTEIYPLNPPWLSDALVYIQRNVSRHLSAADVCTHLKLSHTYVNRILRDRLDTTLQREIRSSQLAEARHLLRSTTLPLSEIAQKAGFSTPQYFCNVFTSALGLSPSAFRNRQITGFPGDGCRADGGRT